MIKHVCIYRLKVLLNHLSVIHEKEVYLHSVWEGHLSSIIVRPDMTLSPVTILWLKKTNPVFLLLTLISIRKAAQCTTYYMNAYCFNLH